MDLVVVDDQETALLVHVQCSGKIFGGARQIPGRQVGSARGLRNADPYPADERWRPHATSSRKCFQGV